MKLLDVVQARYRAALRDAQTQALSRAMGPTEAWRLQAVEALASRVRLSAKTPLDVLLRLTRHWNEAVTPDVLRPALRDLATLVPVNERIKLPHDIRSAIHHFDYVTPTPVTPGGMRRVLLSARLIYRAWRQDA